MHRIFAVILIAFTVCNSAIALLCHECSGSEMSDCAKGVKGAGVIIKCESPSYDPIQPQVDPIPNVNGEASTEPAITTTTVDTNYERLRKLGCYEPIKLYPACVTYSMKPYNAVEGQNMVYRSCMLSPDDFCKSHLQFNKDSTCKSCNSTDFCS